MSAWTARTDACDDNLRSHDLGTLARDERGQVLPLLLVVMVALLAAGMLVFWLGFSTSIATNAQTAADAAALAAEQSVDQQWNTLINVDGVPEPRDSYDPAAVQAAAQSWASKPNQGTVESIQYCSQGGGCSSQPIYTSEPDVLVTVKSTQTLPAGSVSPGAGATTQARASVDPYAQASPSIVQLQTSTNCDPSDVPPPIAFTAHGGQFGFFEASGTNFNPGCESRLAAHLDALGRTLKLHLVGTWGAGATDPGAPGSTPAGTEADLSAAHACGAAVEVQGLAASVTATELARWGLTRLPAQADQIEFLSPTASCATTTTVPAQGTDSQPTSVGNGKVHLVPLTGSPEGSPGLGIGPIAGVGPWPAIASYLPIYEMIAKQYGWNQAQLQDWLGVEQIEDSGGDLGIASDGAFGLAQFQTVNYCHYGPGSCPQDNPTAQQELESMALYIHDVYGDPAAALAHELSTNPHWY
jgi:hypothetical protein